LLTASLFFLEHSIIKRKQIKCAPQTIEKEEEEEEEEEESARVR
jgi:hypothetical protein